MAQGDPPIGITSNSFTASEDSWYLYVPTGIPELKPVEIICEDAWVGDYE